MIQKSALKFNQNLCFPHSNRFESRYNSAEQIVEIFHLKFCPNYNYVEFTIKDDEEKNVKMLRVRHE
jgi:hypothetical protein